MMTTEKKKKKKGFINKDDTSWILRRYSATTIISLIQEVGQFADVKIDWNKLVKKTSTGISNAREYQMLWRHLAYRETLLDEVEDGAVPMDDDSDLDHELEASPPVSAEASVEAAACVKVLLASGLHCDSGPLNRSTVEAPLTINIPNDHPSWVPSEYSMPTCTQGTNITIPVSVRKQPLPTVTVEGLDGNGSASGGLPARRKRKPWTEEEDMELIAAVQKCGERNWANILKGDFKGDRTASQLSQRWAIIRKRQANLNPSGAANSTSSQLSEAQLAARRAISRALNLPMVDRLSEACSLGMTHSGIPSTPSAVPATLTEASPAAGLETSTKSAVGSSFSQALHQTQEALRQTSSSTQKGTSSTTPKSRVTTKKVSSVPVKPSSGPNSLIQAAAVAAGARIATPSTAASLLKAAQSKNAVHIRPVGGSLIKTSMPGGAKTLPANHLGPRPNVHYIRTGLPSVSPPTSYISQSSVSQHGYGNPMKPVTATCQIPPANTAISSNLSAQQTVTSSSLCVNSSETAEGDTTNAISSVGVGFLSEEVKKTAETNSEADGSGSVPREEVQDGQTSLPNADVVSENRMSMVENLRHSPNMEACENDQSPVVNNQIKSERESENMECSPVLD